MRRDEINLIRELVREGVQLGLTLASVYDTCLATGLDVSWEYVERVYREYERKNMPNW